MIIITMIIIIIAHDKDDETGLDSIFFSLSNIEVTKLILDICPESVHSVGKRGSVF